MAKAKPKKICKCRYSHCLHDTKDICLETDDYIQDGKTYYHLDCFQTRLDIEAIKVLWHDEINELVIYSQLVAILNNLIFKEKIPSDYILFAVRYVISHRGYKLQFPPGLKWILAKKEIKAAYEKSKQPKFTEKDFAKAVAKQEKDTPTFSFKPKTTGFGSILGGN